MPNYVDVIQVTLEAFAFAPWLPCLDTIQSSLHAMQRQIESRLLLACDVVWFKSNEDCVITAGSVCVCVCVLKMPATTSLPRGIVRPENPRCSGQVGGSGGWQTVEHVARDLPEKFGYLSVTMLLSSCKCP